MRKKKILAGILLASAVIFSLTGCAVRRKADGISDEMEKMPIFRVEYMTLDREKMTQVFLGMSLEEAKQYLEPPYYAEYEVNNLRLTATSMMGSIEEPMDIVSFDNQKEGAWNCYEFLLTNEIMTGLQTQSMRQFFPEEELDGYSKEEVIEACRLYAEVCGYGDAEVTVYAVTMDVIDELSVKDSGLGLEVMEGFAPNPDFEPVTRQEIYELEVRLEDMDEDSDEYRTLSQKIEELRDKRRDGGWQSGVAWEKKHEAFILTYQPYVGGYLTAESYRFLYIVYVPMYEEPVYVYTGRQYTQVEEILEEVEIVSSEAALGELLMSKGHDREDIEIQKTSLVYAQQSVASSFDIDEEWRKMIPCWRFEYIIDGRYEGGMIDAQYGTLYREYSTQ